jgi:GNAT superfamily N-acetyltransferase
MSHSDLPLVRDLDLVEATAYRDMFAAAPAELASLGLETREVAGATMLMAPGLPTPLFNRVIGLGNSQPASEDAIERIADSYRKAGVRSWWMHLSPGARPASLAATLERRGFVRPARGAWVKMLRDDAAAPEVRSGLEIRQARAGEGQAFGEALCTAFDMPAKMAAWFARLSTRPDWRAVAAIEQGRVIGGGLLHLQDRFAWLGAGGVLPEARGRHVHRALMALRIRLAIEAGRSRVTTETGEPVDGEPNPSLRNMTACGFTQVFTRLNLAAPA